MTKTQSPPVGARLGYPTLHQLAVFLTVARLRSYSRAADELLLSQPSVSMQVRQLERVMGGMPLLERAGRRLLLTDAGEELQVYARDALARIDDAMLVMHELQGMKRGRLRIAADTTAGVYVVPPLLGAFRALYPRIGISMSVVNRTTVQEKLMAHDVDVAVMGHTVPGEDLVVTPLRINRLVVIAPPCHRLVGARAIPLDDLQDEAFVVREQGSGTRASMQRIFGASGLVPTIVMELSDNGAIKQAVAAGIGLAVLSEAALELELAAGRLCVLDVQGFPLVRHWYTVYLAHKRLTPPVRAFLDVLRAQSDPETVACGQHDVS